MSKVQGESRLIECRDAKTGKKYWYNAMTGDVSGNKAGARERSPALAVSAPTSVRHEGHIGIGRAGFAVDISSTITKTGKQQLQSIVHAVQQHAELCPERTEGRHEGGTIDSKNTSQMLTRQAS